MTRPAPVSWTEIRVDVPLGWHELVAEALALEHCTSVSVGNASIGQRPAPPGREALRAYVESGQDTPELRRRIALALAGLAQVSGAEELVDLTPLFKPLPPEDYARSWRKVWRPFRLGRLVVAPPWWEGSLRSGETRLILEPGGAFGSGRPATTRACLRALLERMRGGERVLDAGTGSGILTVTAALLGAREVLGFDVDPTSRTYGEDLAAANGQAARCTFRCGGFESLEEVDRNFDVVLANIYADVIQAQAGELAARLTPRGWFAFSGCATDHRDATLAAIEGAGLVVDQERRRGRWHTFVGGRE